MTKKVYVSIPQAVSTVATKYSLAKEAGFIYSEVSIPQAVSTVATKIILNHQLHQYGFNTASGKYCCNWLRSMMSLKLSDLVSIPQAVSTVATNFYAVISKEYTGLFQYRKR